MPYTKAKLMEAILDLAEVLDSDGKGVDWPEVYEKTRLSAPRCRELEAIVDYCREKVLGNSE